MVACSNLLRMDGIKCDLYSLTCTPSTAIFWESAFRTMSTSSLTTSVNGWRCFLSSARFLSRAILSTSSLLFDATRTTTRLTPPSAVA